METRKITVIETKYQTKNVIMSNATTLSELKRDLDSNGINYTNMSFYEGVSKTELKNDNSILPHDIPYKGNTTNELVFMLTTANKKIKSGAKIVSRADIYNTIRAKGLQNACVQRFGKNFTMCKTTDLLALIEESKEFRKSGETKDIEAQREQKGRGELSVKDAIICIVDYFINNGVLSDKDKQDIFGCTESNTENSNTCEDKISSPYSDSEIDDMLNEMGF